jgi:hypothetical protein
LALVLSAACLQAVHAEAAAAPPTVTLARDGKAQGVIAVVAPRHAPLPPGQKPAKKPKGRPIYLDASATVDDAVDDLARCLQQMSGAAFDIRRSNDAHSAPGAAILIGTPADLGITDAPADLGPEGFLLRTTGAALLIAAPTELGQSHAVYALLEHLGCRWHYPGATWEIVPANASPQISIDRVEQPDFDLMRYPVFVYANKSAQTKRDITDWARRNRVANRIDAVSGHRWPGIDPKTDFADHPDWFALTPNDQGQRVRQPTKPCYTHPEVIRRGIDEALAYLREHPLEVMVSATPPDDANYCECDNCVRAAGAVETFYAHHGTLFGRTADGTVVSVASQTVYAYVNAVARAVAREFPGRFVGTGSYSAYSHPPTFDLEPNVFMVITMGFRRTPLSMDEQLTQYGRRVKNLGVYEYWDVINWDWDLPGQARAADLNYLASSLRYYHQRGIRAIKGEASLNFGPNGIGYHALTRLMWDVQTDVRAVEDDFYTRALGPAAEPVRRFYQRWESGSTLNDQTLGLALRDLQHAADLTRDLPAVRARVDHLRLYAHFLKTSMIRRGPKPREIEQLVQSLGPDVARQRFTDFGQFLSDIMDTQMVQSYGFMEFLEVMGKELGVEASGWRKPGTVPGAAQVDALLAADFGQVDVANLREAPIKLFSRDLARVPHPAAGARPSLGHCSEGVIYLWARAGEQVTVDFELPATPARPEDQPMHALASLPPDAFAAEKVTTLRKMEQLPLPTQVRFVAPITGFHQLCWTHARLVSANVPGVLAGGEFRFDQGALSFFVPADARTLVLQTTGGRPTVRLLDQQGRERFTARRSELDALWIEVPPESAGQVWTMQFEGNSGSHNATVRLLGAPNFFALTPDALLAPRELLKP